MSLQLARPVHRVAQDQLGERVAEHGVHLWQGAYVDAAVNALDMHELQEASDP